MAPTPVLLPGESRGWRSLVGCSPWGREESDMTARLHFHFPLSCIGEGNGNPLQCSCLENPRDRGARWAAVSGVAQSWTRLTRLSSSSKLVLSHQECRSKLSKIFYKNSDLWASRLTELLLIFSWYILSLFFVMFLIFYIFNASGLFYIICQQFSSPLKYSLTLKI